MIFLLDDWVFTLFYLLIWFFFNGKCIDKLKMFLFNFVLLLKVLKLFFFYFPLIMCFFICWVMYISV